jgi:cholesterol transport system auxiliary component
MKRAAGIVTALALIAGCMSLPIPDVPPREYYVLEDLAKAGGGKPGAQGDRVLLVNPASTIPFYDTQSLVFSRAPGQRAYYQFAGWTERPGRALSELLSGRLEVNGGLRAVAATTAGIRGDVVLHIRLEEFYHDVTGKPGSVRIEATAVLVDSAQRTLMARRRFVQSAPATGENAQSAVAAFNRAATALLDEMTAWVESVVAQPAAR